MSLIRNGKRRAFLGVLFSVFLALTLFDYDAATAQERKEIKLTEKHIHGVIAVTEEMDKLYDGADPTEAVAKKNGFASLAEYDDVFANITIIMCGIDPQTKKFAEPPEQIRKQISALKADKSVPEVEKKEDLARLELVLKDAKPIQFKENIALVRKYFDKLDSLIDPLCVD